MAEQIATLGGGCFWCIEAALLRTKGISKVISGYSAGETENPTYKEICTGQSGHAEVVQFTFDDEQISYENILRLFFVVHDPTTPNRQGNDIGTQYRSIILVHDEAQKNTAEQVISDLEKNKVFAAPIVTQVEPLDIFYPAEAYHQNYYDQNSNQPYCQYVINPKLSKMRQELSHLLK